MQTARKQRCSPRERPACRQNRLSKGISGDDKVPASSRHLDRFFAFSRLFSNSSLYIAPGSTMEIYWSAQRMLTMMHVNRVIMISSPLVLATLSSILQRRPAFRRTQVHRQMPVQSGKGRSNRTWIRYRLRQKFCLRRHLPVSLT